MLSNNNSFDKSLKKLCSDPLNSFGIDWAFITSRITPTRLLTGAYL